MLIHWYKEDKISYLLLPLLFNPHLLSFCLRIVKRELRELGLDTPVVLFHGQRFWSPRLLRHISLS